MDIVITIITAAILLSVLVFIHEGGHYLAARAFKVRVTEFMLGLPGPSIGFKRKGTRFGVTAIPLGGYANVCGMAPAPTDPKFKQVMGYAYERGAVTCEEVEHAFNLSNTEAFELLEGLADWGTLERGSKKEGEGTYFVPERDGVARASAWHVNDLDAFYQQEAACQYCFLPVWKRLVILAAGPVMNLIYTLVVFVILYSLIGVDIQNTETGQTTHLTLNPLESIAAGFAVIGTTLQAIVGLFNPATAAETISQSTSIIGIVAMSGDALQAGLANLLFFSALISVSLGLMNLLPIPPLDGGKILIELIQVIIRRNVPMRIQGYLSTAGFALFMLFFLVLANQDIQRFIFGSW